MKNKTRATKTTPESHGEQTVDEITTKVANAIRDELRLFLPIYARLAAADTVHSTERPETVFKRAIDEGILAYNILEGVINAKK